MCNFIKLTCSNHNTVSYINMDMYKEFKVRDGVTRLVPHEKGGTILAISETPEEINTLLNQMRESKRLR